MRRQTILLIGATGAIWLSAHQLVEPPQRAFAEEPKPLAAKQKPKAKKVNAAKAKAPVAKNDKVKAAASDVEPDETDVEPDEEAMKKAKAKADVKAAFGALFRVFGAREKPVAVAVPVPVALPDNDPNFKQFMQQHGGRVRQLIRTEMHFIRIVCQPTKQQYQKIAAEGETVVKSTIRKYAQKQQQRMGRGRVVAGQISETDDPRKLVAEGLFKSVKETLSAEQTARYRKELDLRAAASKRVVLLNVLAKLDEKLVLTAEQRSKLHKSLDKNGINSWSVTHLQMYGQNYIPQLPNNKVLPILNETQKTVWNGISKISNISIGLNALQMLQLIDIEDEVWDDEQPKGDRGTAENEAAAKTDQKSGTNK